MRYLLFMWLCLITIVSTVSAQELSESIRQEISSYKEMLNLKDEQIDQLSSVLETSINDRNKLLKKYGIDINTDRKVRLNFRNKLALKKDLDKFKANYKQQVSSILNDEQMSKWQTIQTEKQAKFRLKIQEKLGSS